MVFLAALSSCTQQLAQRSQSHWLEKNLSQQLYKAQTEDLPEPWQGTIATVVSGYLESTAIGELSGLAASHKNPGVFWAINDSGNRSELYAVNRNGRHLETFAVPESNVDWEDLASFKRDGKSWLVIADTGDNRRRRSSSFLYLVEEPEATAGGTATAEAGRSLATQTTIEFSYEDGPQNVESIAVSAQDLSLIHI